MIHPKICVAALFIIAELWQQPVGDRLKKCLLSKVPGVWRGDGGSAGGEKGVEGECAFISLYDFFSVSFRTKYHTAKEMCPVPQFPHL